MRNKNRILLPVWNHKKNTSKVKLMLYKWNKIMSVTSFPVNKDGNYSFPSEFCVSRVHLFTEKKEQNTWVIDHNTFISQNSSPKVYRTIQQIWSIHLMFHQRSPIQNNANCLIKIDTFIINKHLYLHVIGATHIDYIV